MISADQILAHLVGDYILQSDWMASEKVKRSIAAAVHAVTYALPFLFFRPSAAALIFIVVTHFVIDRWRLARYVVWAKNFIAPPDANFDGWQLRSGATWQACSATGYPHDRPLWLTTWLLIIADNVAHVLLNGVALKWL